MKFLTRFMIVMVLVASPVLLFAGDKKDKDNALAHEIQQRLAGVAPNTVIVVVDEATNTAFLSGSAATQAELDLVASTVRSIDGVRIVGSTMVVRGTEPAVTLRTDGNTVDIDSVDVDRVDDADETITTTQVVDSSDVSLKAAVEEALKSEGIMGQSKIRVETEGGMVTLTGSALSESHADRIVALAQSVPGVVGVNPNITLRDQKRRYQVKPSDDRDKKGFEVGEAESRTDDDR
jgi:osmotically-inducible protein OsmY